MEAARVGARGARQGRRPLPARVPPGPDNPLGRAMRLAAGKGTYLIHGTNNPMAVGMAVTHGCIRMYPEDIEALFPLVPVGTAVRIVNEPVKVAWIDGELLLETHPPVDAQGQTYEPDVGVCRTAGKGPGRDPGGDPLGLCARGAGGAPTACWPRWSGGRAADASPTAAALPRARESPVAPPASGGAPFGGFAVGLNSGANSAIVRNPEETHFCLTTDLRRISSKKPCQSATTKILISTKTSSPKPKKATITTVCWTVWTSAADAGQEGQGRLEQARGSAGRTQAREGPAGSVQRRITGAPRARRPRPPAVRS